ncbi:MAG: M14 family zinc carboxypeptidase [candidate division KSB1 bacterium]|nr:M14 family zinc carboxypeptidase [candidate division KSB1 bacterium]
MRHQLNYTPKIFLMSLVLILLSYVVLEKKKLPQGSGERIPVRISFTSPQEEQRIKALNLKVTAKKEGAYVEALVTWSQLLQLKQQDFDVALIIEVERQKIDPEYHTLEEVEDLLTQLANRYPDILLKTQIGESTQNSLPIWAIKISDNPREDEDEPAVLYTGVHHAREPLGAEICLYLIQQLCQNYRISKTITNWINEIEIWFVPVVNPDGYQLALDENQGLNWWRKNLRDNNTNGRFKSQL